MRAFAASARAARRRAGPDRAGRAEPCRGGRRHPDRPGRPSGRGPRPRQNGPKAAGPWPARPGRRRSVAPARARSGRSKAPGGRGWRRRRSCASCEAAGEGGDGPSFTSADPSGPDRQRVRAVSRSALRQVLRLPLRPCRADDALPIARGDERPNGLGPTASALPRRTWPGSVPPRLAWSICFRSLRFPQVPRPKPPRPGGPGPGCEGTATRDPGGRAGARGARPHRPVRPSLAAVVRLGDTEGDQRFRDPGAGDAPASCRKGNGRVATARPTRGRGGGYRNRTGLHGFAIRCVTSPPTRPHHGTHRFFPGKGQGRIPSRLSPSGRAGFDRAGVRRPIMRAASAVSRRHACGPSPRRHVRRAPGFPRRPRAPAPDPSRPGSAAHDAKGAFGPGRCRSAERTSAMRHGAVGAPPCRQRIPGAPRPAPAVRRRHRAAVQAGEAGCRSRSVAATARRRHLRAPGEARSAAGPPPCARRHAGTADAGCTFAVRPTSGLHRRRRPPGPRAPEGQATGLDRTRRAG